MKKTILFAALDIYSDNPTGGIRRFRELTEYLNKTSDIIVCSMDSHEIMEAHGISNHYHLESGKNTGLYKLLPPVFRIFRTNKGVISLLKKESYNKVIVFDVPHTIGLVFSGFHNINLLIRKDLIGYEKISNKSNVILKNAKLAGLLLWETICFYKVNKILTQCEYDKCRLINRHPFLAGLIERKTIVQINNVNPSWIVEKSRITPIPSNLGRTGVFRVCFIGGFNDKRKGQNFFLRVAQEMLKTEKNVDFILIGGGEELTKYQNQYSHPSIRFMGKMDNPIKVLKQCELLIVPSLADSCPNTVMEALYNEVLVLGSKRGGIPEVLVDEESLFEMNVRDLSDKIAELKNCEKSREKLKQLQLRRKASLTFNWPEKILSLL